MKFVNSSRCYLEQRGQCFCEKETGYLHKSVQRVPSLIEYIRRRERDRASEGFAYVIIQIDHQTSTVEKHSLFSTLDTEACKDKATI